jgi:branched-chain amino acid transport system substrate-binding protein
VIDPAEPYLFGTLPRIGQIAQADTTFAVKSLHAKKIGLVYEDDEVGIPAMKTIPNVAKSLGAKLVASESAEDTTTDFAPIANRLSRSGASVVQILAGPTIIAGVQKAAAAIGYKPKWVVLFVADSPAYLSLVGSLANGVYVDQDQLIAGSPQFAQFKAAITKVASPAEVNDSFAQQGWSAASILMAGVQKATAGGKPLTAASFLAALDGLKASSVGLLPDVDITSTNHVADDASGMLEVTGKTFKQVSPFVRFTASK